MKEAAQRPAIVLAELAADQIEGLDAVGALVDLRNAGVAHELLHAVVADVAVTAIGLHAQVRNIEPDVGDGRLDQGRQERDQILRGLALLRVRMALGAIELQRDPERQRPRPFGERPHGHQVAAHARVDDDRIGRLVRVRGAGERPALQALARIGDRRLIGGFGEAQPLQADRQTRHVHHGEHGAQAGMGRQATR